MYTIELIGVDFNNKGALLMLQAVLERLEKAPVNNRFVIAPNSHATFQQRQAVGAWQKLELKRFGTDLGRFVGKLPGVIRRRIALWGLLTEADVDMVLDLSGYAYGDPWPAYRLRYQAAYAQRLNHQKKPYILLPQALGPFKNDHIGNLAKQLLSNSALVYARDKQSFASCNELLSSDLVQQSPDFTLEVKARLTNETALPENTMVIIPNQKMQTHIDSNSPWQRRYLETILKWVSLAEEHGLVPVLLNHEGNADRELCQQINSHFNNRLNYLEFADARDIKGVIRTSRLVLSSRYHGCVSALTQGIPVIATSWSHKYQELFADFDCADHIISPDDESERWSELIVQQIQRPSDYGKAIATYQTKTDQLWSTIYNLMQ